MAGPLQTGTVTHEEWQPMPQWGQQRVVHRERIMFPNQMPHPGTLGALTVALVQGLDRTTCESFWSEFGLVIHREPPICREPDRAVFEPSTTFEPDGYIHSQPQLAIELSSSESQTKTTEKLRNHESIGTEEVWYLSPEAATVEDLYLERGGLGRNTIFAEGVLRPKHLLNVPIDSPQIWPD
jgi:Uma2 family endonuclease